MKIAALYLVLAVAIAGGLSFVGKFWTYARLAGGALQASAVVKTQTCSDHLTLRYGFSVDGRSFEAVATSDECTKLVPGTSITVFYLPANPNLSVIGHPASHLRNEGISIGLAALVLPALLLWAYAKRTKASGA
jgi:hypothetical protein